MTSTGSATTSTTSTTSSAGSGGAPAAPARPPGAAATNPAAVTRLRRALSAAGVVAFVLAVSYLVVVPLIRLQLTAFVGGAAGYRTAYGQEGIGGLLLTTVALGVGSLAIALVLGTLLAWAGSRLPRRYRLLRALPVIPIVIPSVAGVVGWTFLFSPRPGYLNALLRELPWWSHLDSGPVDIYTVHWIVIITGFALTSFVYLFVSAGLQNINQEHIDAAQVCGSGPAGVFFRVVLPLLRPSLIYGSGVVLLLGLGQFTSPLLLGTNQGIQVVTTEMFSYVSESPLDFGAAAAFGSPLVIFGLVVVILQKVGLGDQTRFVTHGGTAFKAAGRPARTAVLVIVLYSAISTGLPLIALVLVALSDYWSGTLDPGRFTLNNLTTVLTNVDTADAIVTSVVASAAAVGIVLPVGFVAATILLRGQRFGILRAVLDFVVALPLGIPAVIFGVGFLLTYTYPPLILYGSRWVIILVYTTLMLPFGTRMLLSSMIGLGQGYAEASRVSGAGALATNVKIVLPLLRAGVGGAAALMFVLLTHEFSASLLVRSPTIQVMGTVLFDYWTNGSYPTVAAIALVMTAVTGAGMATALMIGGRDVLSRL
jgi:iron(III) transport system permease protein